MKNTPFPFYKAATNCVGESPLLEHQPPLWLLDRQHRGYEGKVLAGRAQQHSHEDVGERGTEWEDRQHGLLTSLSAAPFSTDPMGRMVGDQSCLEKCPRCRQSLP